MKYVVTETYPMQRLILVEASDIDDAVKKAHDPDQWLHKIEHQVDDGQLDLCREHAAITATVEDWANSQKPAHRVTVGNTEHKKAESALAETVRRLLRNSVSGASGSLIVGRFNDHLTAYQALSNALADFDAQE